MRSHTGANLIESVIREQAGDLLKARRGVCPDCAGALDTEVVDAESETTPDGVSVPFATAQDAINIAVAELGKRVAKAGEAIRNANISVQSARCRGCETEMDVATIVSGRALVGPLLTVEVRASCPNESGIIGQREIGLHVPDTPLTLVESPG